MSSLDLTSSGNLVLGKCSVKDCDATEVSHSYCERHLRERLPAEWILRSPILGKTEPRLWTPEARPLTRETTRGFEVIDFARHVIGEPLYPWQEWLVKHALELNPDGTFRFRVILVLVARQNGKTHVLKTVSLWRMFVDDARLILGAAQSLDIAREAWQACVDTSRATPELSELVGNVRFANGEQALTLHNGARYRITAATRSAGRGLSVDQLNLDEIREQRDWLAWSALSKTTSARPNGQIWAISNAGDEQSIVLNHLRAAAIAQTDPSIFLAEWSAPDGCDLDDWEAIAQANPSLGHGGLTHQAVRTSLATDPPAVYRTEVLCQQVDVMNAALDLGAWKACADPLGNMDSLRDRVALCLDVAPDGQHATLVAAAVQPDTRVRVEVVRAWKSTEDLRRELAELVDRIDPVAFGWFQNGPAAAVGDIVRTMRTKVTNLGPMATEVCQGLADIVTARRIVHPNDPLLNAQASNAEKLNQGDGWRFVRRNAGHVDSMYATGGGVHLALTTPVKDRPRIIVVPRAA